MIFVQWMIHWKDKNAHSFIFMKNLVPNALVSYCVLTLVLKLFLLQSYDEFMAMFLISFNCNN